MENLSKKQKIILIILAIVVMIGIGLYIRQQEKQYEYFEEFENTEQSNIMEEYMEEEVKTITIHIVGCVENEGLVVLEEGSRVADAIEKAGGATLDADLSKINLAYKLSDGQKIYIPSINEDEVNEYVTEEIGNNIIIEDTKNIGGSEMVNINTANQSELETLPGIGPSTALKIIEHREQNGKFDKIEDITNVKGIGDSKYESIKDLIEV